jgi:hypothetical protein
MPASHVEIRIRGRLDDAALARLGDAYGRVEVRETVLGGDVADQAQLHGLLDLLQDLGCELLEVRKRARRTSDTDIKD